MIPIACKITYFSLYLFVNFFWKHNNFGWFIHAYCFKKKNGWHAPRGLIIETPISQYTLYSAMFCQLHSNISKEQHEKHLCNSSSHYGKYTCETHAPYLDRWKPWCLNFSNVELVSCKQGIAWEVPQRSLCLALKPLCVYRKSSPYTVVMKEWEIKGIQR